MACQILSALSKKKLPHQQASVKRDQVRRGSRGVQLGHLQTRLLCDVAGIQPERAEFHLSGITSSLTQPSDITRNPANTAHSRGNWTKTKRREVDETTVPTPMEIETVTQTGRSYSPPNKTRHFEAQGRFSATAATELLPMRSLELPDDCWHPCRLGAHEMCGDACQACSLGLCCSQFVRAAQDDMQVCGELRPVQLEDLLL